MSVFTNQKFLDNRPLILLAILLMLLVAAGGILFYENREEVFRTQKYKELNVIANLKAKWITQWFTERKKEVSFASKTPLFVALSSFYVKNPDKLKAIDVIKKRLSFLKKELDYEDVLFADLNGSVKLSTLNKPVILESHIKDKLIESRDNKKILFTDLYYSQDVNHIVYDIIAPIVLKEKIIAMIIFRRNPEDRLYPLLREWHAPNSSGETIISRKEKDSILFLCQTKFARNSALKLRLPLSNTKLPSVQGAKGFKGVFEGIDYRGVKVIADVRKFPESNWILVTKVDSDEIFTELNQLAIGLIGFILFLMVLTGSVVAFTINRNQLNFYKQLYLRDEELIVKQKKIAENEARFRSTLDAMLEGCQIIGYDFSYIYLNEEVLKQSLKSKEELLGRKMHECFPGIENTETYQLIGKCLTDRRPSFYESSFVVAEGIEHFFNLSLLPVPEGALVLSRDVTEKKLAENEILAAKEKAEEMNRLKSSFLANISHELRSPLIAINGYSEVLINMLDGGNERSMAEKILKSGNRLKDTIDQILDLSKIESETMEFNTEIINLISETDQIIDIYSMKAAEKGIGLIARYNSDVIECNIDPQAFNSIVANLVNNAIKFTFEGSVTVDINKMENNLQIKVSDTGIGISEEDQVRVFEPFRQISEGYNRNFGGTGLGLSIVKKIVEKLNGSIHLQSEPGKGTVFIISIPDIVNTKC